MAETYSILTRGSSKEKLNWLFDFYDINKRDKIGRLEILAVVKSFYDLIKRNNSIISSKIIFDHVIEAYKVLFFCY